MNCNYIRLEKEATSYVYQSSDCDNLPSRSKKAKTDIDGLFTLIRSNKTNVKEIHFKENKIGKEETFVRVNAFIAGSKILGFIDLKKYPELLNRVKLLSAEEATQKINDYVFDIDPILVKNVEIFIYLGVTNESDQKIIMSSKAEDIAQLTDVFDRVFSGDTIEDKIISYEVKKNKLQRDSQSLILLNKIFVNGLAIKIFKDEVQIDKIENYKFIEFKIANQAKTDLRKAIYKASFCGCESLVLFLSLNSKDQEKLGFILTNTIYYGQESLVRNIFEKYSDQISAEDLENAVIFSSQKGYESIVNYLLSKNLGKLLKAISNAIYAGQEDLVEKIFEKYSDQISAEDLKKLVLYAAQKGNQSIVDFLLFKNLGNLVPTIISSVCYEQEILICNLFSRYFHMISDEDLKIFIIHAVRKGNEPIVNYFLSKNILNLVETIIIATYYGKDDLVKNLFEKYVIMISDEDLKKIVICAVQKVNQPIIDFLLSKNQFNLSIAITNSAFYGKKILVQNIFEKHGKSISFNDLKTSFVFALQEGHQSIAYFLLNKLINIKIPLKVKESIVEIISSSFTSESSWEGLLRKLGLFASNTSDIVLRDFRLKILDQTFERIKSEFSFTETLKEKDLLSSVYDYIKDTMAKIDSKIDPDPNKHIEEKKNLLKIFEFSGVTWRSNLDQIKQRLVCFPEDVPVEIFIGKIISDTVNKISESINNVYSVTKQKQPDIRDLNRIKFYLRDYLAEEVLDDNLSELRINFDQVMIKFSEKFNLGLVIDKILESVKTKPVFKNKLDDYYKSQLFKGCESNDEIDFMIEINKTFLQEDLENLSEIQRYFNDLHAIMGNISFDDKISILNILINSETKEELKTKVESFNDEKINKLFEQKNGVIGMFKFLKELKMLFNKFSYKNILTYTKEQLIQLYVDSKQSIVEFYLLEDFVREHTKDQFLLASGVDIILKKMGFSNI